ncbi:MAG: hypothetical protein KGL35_00360 [Bradyrhizobium sp.]|nr:hypothetical protein [Bradyrhizobium sp.]
MADIFDIVASTETVKLGGVAIEVGGVPLGDFLKIVKRFPAVIAALKREQVEPAVWFDCGAEAIAALLAAGVGKLGDADAEARIGRFPGAYQLALLKSIMAQTMPDGPGPFVRELMTVLGATRS